MTTLAAILTLPPWRWTSARGGMPQPLAIAIISGLLGQFPLVLLGLPMRLGIGLGRKTRA